MHPGPILAFHGAKAKACINCRRRKIKCDGSRPTCAQCARSPGFQDCEYAEDGPTTTQMLEERIAMVQARIEEHKKPKELRTSIGIFNPHTGENRSGSGTSLALPMPHSHRSSSGSLYPSGSSDLIPPHELRALIHKFLHHSSQFGFFLNIQRFRDAYLGISDQRLDDRLLDVVHLWAIHISGSEKLAQHEASYLARALQPAAIDPRKNDIVHSIQAEVLLAYYFVENTRFLEGKYHVSAACSLVISSGLHQTSSGHSNPSSRQGVHALAPPRDAIQESERINAGWAVGILNNCWTTADGSPSNVGYTAADARVDIPWPLDINGFQPPNQPASDHGIGTVHRFLANKPDNGTSVIALYAKASILFERVSALVSHYHPAMSEKEQLERFRVSFSSLATLIDRVKRSLPPVESHTNRRMLVIHSLVHVATIQLHNRFVGQNPQSRIKELSAARCFVEDLSKVDVKAFVYVDPIMGTLWMAACQVFIAELKRLRRSRPPNLPVPREEQSLVDAVETILRAMRIFAPRCRLIDSQLSAIQQTYLRALNS
ncbi:Zn(2)-Cys(6) binuclear cluster domain-containing protein [Mycena rebaudengoi]|nr:Zn(2)-Cys(6) binuclear cluster domain-containing protein [Mycena rebaudengoi]